MVVPRVRASRSQPPGHPIGLTEATEWAEARFASHHLGVSEKTLGRCRLTEATARSAALLETDDEADAEANSPCPARSHRLRPRH